MSSTKRSVSSNNPYVERFERSRSRVSSPHDLLFLQYDHYYPLHHHYHTYIMRILTKPSKNLSLYLLLFRCYLTHYYQICSLSIASLSYTLKNSKNRCVLEWQNSNFEILIKSESRERERERKMTSVASNRELTNISNMDNVRNFIQLYKIFTHTNSNSVVSNTATFEEGTSQASSTGALWIESLSHTTC